MGVIDEATLSRIEKESSEGLTSQQILALFSEHGVGLTEATLRKYVQLGLLPRSVRVGQKGKHRGSRGVYPVRVVRQILLIKEMMSQQLTIEQIQKEFLFLRGEIEQLDEVLGVIFGKLDEAASLRRDRGERLSDFVQREISEARGISEELVGRLRSVERRLNRPSHGQGTSQAAG